MSLLWGRGIHWNKYGAVRRNNVHLSAVYKVFTLSTLLCEILLVHIYVTTVRNTGVLSFIINVFKVFLAYFIILFCMCTFKARSVLFNTIHYTVQIFALLKVTRHRLVVADVAGKPMGPIFKDHVVQTSSRASMQHNPVPDAESCVFILWILRLWTRQTADTTEQPCYLLEVSSLHYTLTHDKTKTPYSSTNVTKLNGKYGI